MGSPSAYSLRALETARECVILGARPRTIAHLTGLTPGYILRAVYCERYPAPIGRPQYSEDFFFKTTRRLQAEACFLATHYRRLTREGFMQADALIAAFRHHRATQPDSIFGFDQAFFLISRLDGIWAATKSGLSFVECLNCRSPYLAPHGMAQRDSCPVCRTDWRLKSRARARVRASSPPAPPVDPPKLNRPRQDAPWQLDLDIAHVRLVGRLQQLGAGDKVLAVLAEEPRAKLFRAPRGRPTVTSAYLSRPMPLATWSAKTEVTHRVQYAVFASHFRRVVRLDLSLTEAMCAAFETTRRACRDYPKPVSFDRCFEVAALLDGIWGVTEKKLELLQCASCSSHYLVSKADSHPSGCPFCMLIRRHRILLPALAA